MPDPVRVFVSHHHSPAEDAFTARLVADLQIADADVWVDQQNIASDDFVRKISEGLAGRQWLVLVMTPAAIASPWVQREVNTALNEQTAGRMLGVIPVVMTPCHESAIPLLWRTLQRYDATRGYEQARDRLLLTFGLVAPVASRPVPYQPPAPAPYVPPVPPVYQAGTPYQSATGQKQAPAKTSAAAGFVSIRKALWVPPLLSAGIGLVSGAILSIISIVLHREYSLVDLLNTGLLLLVFTVVTGLVSLVLSGLCLLIGRVGFHNQTSTVPATSTILGGVWISLLLGFNEFLTLINLIVGIVGIVLIVGACGGPFLASYIVAGRVFRPPWFK
jgi:hypothetical protein